MHYPSPKTHHLKPRLIGIDASRAFLKRRTGIEEYSYQVIKHLRDVLPQETEVVLYVRKRYEVRSTKYGENSSTREDGFTPIFDIRYSIFGKHIQFGYFVQRPDFSLPTNWTIRGIWAPRFWTQVGLSLEMLFHRPDVLFIPAHTVPLIHPQKTVVTVHGLEYEFCPESYAWYERLYMRWSIRFSVRSASQVIAVSENTKRDLMQLYEVPEEKISVIYEGIALNNEFRISNFDSKTNERIRKLENSDIQSKFKIQNSRFFLFIGRLEERKNVRRIVEAFEYFKERTKLSHQLVLAGKPGYGYMNIKDQISKSKYQGEIHELGYVSEEEKWELLKQAEAFVFPSLYEGFGLPVIEAQSVGIPVVTSNISSLPEIAGDGAILVDPMRSKEIGRALVALATDEGRRAGIIDEATSNAGRFSWAACARGVASLLR